MKRDELYALLWACAPEHKALAARADRMLKRSPYRRLWRALGIVETVLVIMIIAAVYPSLWLWLTGRGVAVLQTSSSITSTTRICLQWGGTLPAHPTREGHACSSSRPSAIRFSRSEL